MSPGVFSARVIAPIHFVSAGGRHETIPLGPCLVEAHDERCVDIVWGASGEESAALDAEAVENAELSGKLVLLDEH